MTLSNKNKSSIKPGVLKHIAFVLILFFSISSFSQNLPQIITDRKIASQNYLPDYSYAGYHFGEVQLPKKIEQVKVKYGNNIRCVNKKLITSSENVIKLLTTS